MANIERLIQLANLENLNSKDDFTKEDKDSLDGFFNEFLKKGLVCEELLQKVGEEKYNKIKTFVEENNKDYFGFQKIVKNNKNDLVGIFDNCLAYFDVDSFTKYQKKHTKAALINTLNIFNRAVDFCIDRNYSNATFAGILVRYYDCPEDTALEVADAFGRHRDHLAIVKILTQTSKK